jgi:hypothetical protein
MRIFLPGAALTTTALATEEIYRLASLRMKVISLRNDNGASSISLAICTLEALSMLIFGASLSAGLYGPFLIPVHVLYISFSMFLGSGTFVTFVLGLHLREECLAICSRGHLKRDIFVQFRVLIILVGTTCFFLDLFPIIVSSLFLYWNERYEEFLQIIDTIYYLFKNMFLFGMYSNCTL